MAERRRVGILTGGGDVPGLNVAIKVVVSQAPPHDIDIIGIRTGWQGLLCVNPDDPPSAKRHIIPLTVETVRTIDRTGGTFLHTSRTNPSSMKPDEVPEYVRAEDRTPIDKGKIDCTRHILRVIEFLKLDAIIPIGGDDTLSFACRLHKEGVQIVGHPKDHGQ